MSEDFICDKFPPATIEEMHRLYHVVGVSRMRIAMIFDCRLREVNEVLEREPLPEPVPEPEPQAAHRSDVIHFSIIRRAKKLNEQRRGKRRTISEVQNSAIGKRTKAVTLPRISILERAD